MKKKSPIRETDLHAYVDQQLSESKRKEVEEWLNHHPEDVKRVHRWQLLNRSIKLNIGKEEGELIPSRLDPKKIEKRIRLRRKGIVISMLLVLASGLFGWCAHALYIYKRGFDIALPAMAAHKVFVIEKAHPVEVWAEQEQYLVQWLSQRLDYQLHLPRLHSLGYNLVGGRLLSIDNGPAAQFMYQNNEGKRITLFVARGEEYNNTKFSSKQNNQLNTYFWLTGDIAYAITGADDDKELKRISKFICLQIRESETVI